MTFGVRHGCRHWDDDGAEIGENGQSGALAAGSIRKFRVGDTLVSLLGPSDAEAPDALRGYTVEVDEAERLGFYLTVKPHWQREDIDQELSQRPVKPTAMFQTQVNLDALEELPTNGTHCYQLLTQTWPEKERNILDLCLAWEQFTERLGDDIGDFRQKLQHVGGGIEKGQYLVHSLEYPNAIGRYTLVGKNQAFWSRIVDLAVGDDVGLEIILDPSGTVEGGRARRLAPLGPRERDLVQREHFYFGARFSPIELKRDTFGDREAIITALQTGLTKPRHQEAKTIMTDGWGATVDSPISIGIVEENGIDLSYASLVPRLDVASDAAASLVRRQHIVDPLMGPSGTILRYHLDLAQGHHGLAVASRLLADLPYAKGTLFPLPDAYDATTLRGRDRFIEHIQTLAPPVINVSLTTRNEMPDRDAWFGEVFTRFKDDIVFVVASGNDAGSVADVCPASIGYKHENVIVVAGSDEGTIHPWSNAGAAYVHVAAPMCPPTIVKQTASPPTFAPQKQCGTSFATAIVSNIAAKAHGLCPTLVPRQVRDVIMAFCGNEKLDVACGGIVRQPALEEFLETLCSADAS